MEQLPLCDYYGIDISEKLLGIARKRVGNKGIKFLKGDAESIGSELGIFDIVLGTSILHHLNLFRALYCIKEILKPGGKILFMEPNMMNPQVWLEKNVKFIGKITQNVDGETAFYKSQLADALRKVGFTEISIEPFDFMHPAIPRPLVPYVRRMCTFLEEVPVVKELAGSLMIKAKNPNVCKEKISSS